MTKDLKALIRMEKALIAEREKRLKKLQALEQEIAQLVSGEVDGDAVKATGKKRGRKKDVTKKSGRGAPRGKRSGPTMSETIRDLVSASGGGTLTSGDLVREVIRVRESTKPPSVYATLNKLKKDGKLYQEGSLWYSNP